jgi:hypothetical protein
VLERLRGKTAEPAGGRAAPRTTAFRTRAAGGRRPARGRGADADAPDETSTEPTDGRGGLTRTRSERTQATSGPVADPRTINDRPAPLRTRPAVDPLRPGRDSRAGLDDSLTAARRGGMTRVHRPWSALWEEARHEGRLPCRLLASVDRPGAPTRRGVAGRGGQILKREVARDHVARDHAVLQRRTRGQQLPLRGQTRLRRSTVKRSRIQVGTVNRSQKSFLNKSVLQIAPISLH